MLILTITGEAALRDTLRSALGESSCQFLAPVPAEEVAATVRRVGPDAVLWDAGSAPLAGAPALAGLLKADPAPPPVLLLAPPADRDEAMQAVRAGVYDFLTTPLHLDELALRIRRVQEVDHLRREAALLRDTLEKEAVRTMMIAESEIMRRIRDTALTVAPGREPVLVIGEPGVGKKSLAEFIHRSGNRRRIPLPVLVADQAGEDFFESELWHQARTAGNLVIDRLDALPAALQERFLALLARDQGPRSGQSSNDGDHVRLIGIGGTDLPDLVQEGRLSAELHQRLSMNLLKVPPLRDRPADIPALLAHFAQRAARRLGRPVSVSPRALPMLAVYPWPGNVRELEAAVDRAAALGGPRPLEYADFALLPSLNAPGDAQAGMLALKAQIDTFEREVIQQALQAAKGNRQAAARLLGVSLRTLFYKIKRYRL